MKLTEYLAAELDREVERSRVALTEIPAGKYDWKPHEKSMILGYLANMVATMPSWMAMGVRMNELDVAPAGGSAMKQERLETSAALVQVGRRPAVPLITRRSRSARARAARGPHRR